MSSSRLFFAILAAVFAAGGGCGGRGGTASGANSAPALFAASPCPALPALANARCGYLVVPEDRTRPTSRSIRLLVAIIPARSAPAKSDPVVYLAGGPGGIAIAEAPILIEAGINRDRNLILMDQRGTLYSEPALTCPDMDQFFVRSLGLLLDAPSTGMLHAAAARACHLRSVATGATSAPITRTKALPTSRPCAPCSESSDGTCSGCPMGPISHSH